MWEPLEANYGTFYGEEDSYPADGRCTRPVSVSHRQRPGTGPGYLEFDTRPIDRTKLAEYRLRELAAAGGSVHDACREHADDMRMFPMVDASVTKLADLVKTRELSAP